MRYTVSMPGCESVVEFDDLREARHYARANGGIVWDNDKWEMVYDYRD